MFAGIEFNAQCDYDSLLMDNKEKSHTEESRITEIVPQRLPGKCPLTPETWLDLGREMIF